MVQMKQWMSPTGFMVWFAACLDIFDIIAKMKIQIPNLAVNRMISTTINNNWDKMAGSPSITTDIFYQKFKLLSSTNRVWIIIILNHHKESIVYLVINYWNICYVTFLDARLEKSFFHFFPLLLVLLEVKKKNIKFLQKVDGNLISPLSWPYALLIFLFICSHSALANISWFSNFQNFEIV